jgi:hypothetical protein
VNLVKQEKFGECGLACIAMVLGCSLEEAREKCGDFDWSNGVNSKSIISLLAQNRIAALESLTWPDASIAGILTVPSLNHAGVLHFIVWDGEKYLDPANGEKVYPDDAPVINGIQVKPQWASVILLFM